MRGRDAAAMLVLLLLPPLAALPALSGWLDPGPLAMLSGVVTPLRVGPVDVGTPGWIDISAGPTLQALGHRAAEDWLRGAVPWWNPYSGVGLPLAAEMQPAALFLPFVLLLHFAGGPLYLKLVLQVLAGAGAALLLGRLGAGRWARTAGGALFSLGGVFAWVGDSPMLPVAFLPWTLLGLEAARERAARGAPGGWAVLAGALAYALYAGFPETAFIDGLLALGWAATRFAGLARGARPAFARKVAAGGATGLLLAAPQLWPFFQGLGLATVGARALVDFRAVAMPPHGLVTWLLPYALGPIDGFAIGGTLHGPSVWLNSGGFLGLGALVLAVLAPHRGARERPVRWLLLGWVAAALGRSAGVPGVSGLVNLVPLLDQVNFTRYAPASWQFAATVLGALALDDWARGWRPGRAAVAGALALAAALTAGALVLAAPAIGPLLRNEPRYPPWLLGSLLLAPLAPLLLAVALRRRPGPREAAALGGALVAQAALLYAVPLLSGWRESVPDEAALGFLRDRLGLARVATLGPLRPNYGAFFGIAQVNHHYVPVPRAWAAHVRGALEPYGYDEMFNGTNPEPPPGMPGHADALLARLPAYAALGVRYVLADTPNDPLRRLDAPALAGGGNAALPVAPGEEARGVLPGAGIGAGAVTAAGVAVGTYAGTADGELALTLCAGETCASGGAPLAGAADNGVLWVPLPPGLATRPGKPVAWTVAHRGGGHAFALWLWPAADGNGRLPRLVLEHGPPPGLRPAFRGRQVSIYELAAPAPYVEAPGCRLRPSSRTAVEAECDAPSALLRRELPFPGWTARVNGSPVPVEPAAPVFQRVALPAGRSRVVFRYAPPGIGWAWAAGGLGLASLGWGLRRRAPGWVGGSSGPRPDSFSRSVPGA